MYGQYLLAVLKRAFQPTARFTDILQILAASFAPAFARFLGVAVPTPDETLAYIGAAAVAFVILRIFFVAPYQVWREQVGELGALKLELSKPERMELERFAVLKGEARARLSGKVSEYYWALMTGNHTKAERLYLECASEPLLMTSAYGNGLAWLSHYAARDKEGHKPYLGGTLLHSIQQYLHGVISAEDLASQLPPKPNYDKDEE